MKRIVQQARTLGVAVAGAVRRAVDPPLAADARPLDVKRAIVEAVERLVEPAGGGRRVLSGGAVQVTVMAEHAEQRKALEPVLADVGETIKARLRELQCRVPRHFGVAITYVRRTPPGWDEGQRLAVSVGGDEPAAAATRAVDEAAEPPPALTIDVIRGQAARRHFTFTDRVIRIGRSADPLDERGRPRVNDVAFLENDTPENRTVTRGHAVIRFDARTREYRLFDEGSANGTRVMRSGEVIEVPRRDPVGLALRSGDEVQLGQAVLRIVIR
jgi:hypothetical protein